VKYFTFSILFLAVLGLAACEEFSMTGQLRVSQQVALTNTWGQHIAIQPTSFEIKGVYDENEVKGDFKLNMMGHAFPFSFTRENVVSRNLDHFELRIPANKQPVDFKWRMDWNEIERYPVQFKRKCTYRLGRTRRSGTRLVNATKVTYDVTSEGSLSQGQVVNAEFSDRQKQVRYLDEKVGPCRR
jgi:hypothetical protein